MLDVLLTQAQIQSRVAEMAAQIRRDFPDRLHLVAVLKGAFVFLSDLVRHMEGNVSLDFMAVSSYAKGTTTSGEVRLLGYGLSLVPAPGNCGPHCAGAEPSEPAGVQPATQERMTQASVGRMGPPGARDAPLAPPLARALLPTYEIPAG